jgi:GNAT superfamily N-acetyltransferase
MIDIRIAHEKDAEIFLSLMLEEAAHHGALDQVHTDLTEIRRAGFGKDRKFGVLLAECDGIPAGYISYTVNYSVWLGAEFMMIDDVFVVERFRGRKIGEALMLRAKAIAMISGYRRIRWGVESDNHGAIRFYQRLGATLHTKGVCTWDLRDVE